MIIGTGIDLVITIIFVENQPGIDVGDIAGDIDLLSKDENLWKIVYSIVGLVSDIDIAIDRKSAIDVHGESIHKLFAGGVTSGDKVTTTIELVEIGGAVHSAETGVSLVVKLGEAEIILRGGFIGGETGDGIARISDDGIAEAGLETGEDGGTDAGDAGFTRFIMVRDREWT